jgi:hypothetical protein
MSTDHDREYDRDTPRRADDPETRPGKIVRLHELAALVRNARRLLGTRGSEKERAAFLADKARLLRRLDDVDDHPCPGGESR